MHAPCFFFMHASTFSSMHTRPSRGCAADGWTKGAMTTHLTVECIVDALKVVVFYQLLLCLCQQEYTSGMPMRCYGR